MIETLDCLYDGPALTTADTEGNSEKNFYYEAAIAYPASAADTFFAPLSPWTYAPFDV